MKAKKVSSLKNKMLMMLFLSIGISFGMITSMFLYTTKSLEKKTMDSVSVMTSEINTQINTVLNKTRIASESMANDSLVTNYLDRKYDSEQPSVKNVATLTIRNQIMQGFNRTENLKELAAIYSVTNQELFNLLDYRIQDQQTIEKLMQLGIAERDKLSMYEWYPLQENFLESVKYKDPRMDNVIFGSRRIYSSSKSTYPYIHIFMLQEQQIYECYDEIVEEKNAKVYIMTEQGGVLSSSEIEVVESRQVPEEIKALLSEVPQQNMVTKIDEEDYFVNIEIVGEEGQWGRGNDWITVVAIPKASVMGEVNNLYISIFLIMLFCVTICAIMIFYLYKKFMTPISALGKAMQKVDSGDLQAYVEYKEDTSETSQILNRYNLMLKNINVSMEERLLFEAEKQDLDMQVLTSQIDPHFLYNTLETIVWKANEANRPDIGKIASSLGKLYRLSVNGGQMWTTVDKEIQHVQSYIEIQKARYQDQVKIEYRVEQGVNEIRLPKLVLQPIVENVFIHAMPENETPIKVRITVKMISNEILELKVVDNGPGIEKEKLQQLRKDIKRKSSQVKEANVTGKSSGIGLRNINARLQLYIGDKGSLKVYSKEKIGTKVIICIVKK